MGIIVLTAGPAVCALGGQRPQTDKQPAVQTLLP